jgi:hypothetical protein
MPESENYIDDEDLVPTLEGGEYNAYEECPDCPPEGSNFCMTCWGDGLVPHEC